MTESNIFDVQGSEPYAVDPDTGEPKYRGYVNVRLHVLAETMERVVELMHEHHPQVRLHQIIKRNSVSDVILDPLIFGDAKPQGSEGSAT
jgi:hypothetical protein